MDENQSPLLDSWAEWLLHRRHGGDPELLQRQLFLLRPIRDRILDNAALRPTDTLLDVGAGDGLVAFGALARLGPSGHVVFNDISQDLLDHASALATSAGVAYQCKFVKAAAEDLSDVASGSVDVVTMRAVLIYVADKRGALREFHRVLRPTGRLSLHEPINQFGHAAMFGSMFFGIPVDPVASIWAKMRALYDRLQPPGDPMLDFDERDLLVFAEDAGFGEIHMEYRADVTPPPERLVWERVVSGAGNPKIPSISEAMRDALTSDERTRFEDYFRPRLEGGMARFRNAGVYLWAAKGPR
jgi:ubiquinone/menaquinone biosynthesis C-methylase UbiE